MKGMDIKMKIPRIMFAAVSSGSGKTQITAGILQALKNRGVKVAPFKCGPDYIDPMFHTLITGNDARNLDCFFLEDEMLNYVLANGTKAHDMAVIEGVMGFYDGISITSDQGSSYELAKKTKTPVVLILDAHGMSVSILAVIQGFLSLKEDHTIIGVILNRTPEVVYKELKHVIEETYKISVFGYVPEMEEMMVESRHLGLHLPSELKQYQKKMQLISEKMEETLDISAIISCAKKADELQVIEPVIQTIGQKVKIAVAKDEAFCFYYKDNFELLEKMGAELVYFSPIRDEKLPDGIQGMLLGGGYPELHARELSGNRSMCAAIQQALEVGIPCLAECGGFMYLHEEMEDLDGISYKMVGSITGRAFITKKLQRFGYITVKEKQNAASFLGEEIKGHEFHYYDSTNCGTSCYAKRPVSQNGWDCMHASGILAAGFPHLYYYSNPKFPFRFLEACL